MTTHRRQESTMNNHFSFSNSIQRDDQETQIPSSSHHLKDYNTWAEGIKTNHIKFGEPRKRNSGAWTSRVSPNSNSAQFDRAEESRWLAKREDSESDTSSPTLWQNSPSRENLYGARSNDGKFDNYSTSRAQEIAGYRKEMIDMVRGLPETAYELSLRDIVEKRKEFEDIKPVKAKPNKKKETKKKKSLKKNPSLSRSKSSDAGLLIKLFLPLSIGTKKSFNSFFKEKNEPKEEAKEKEKKIEKDEEWWRKNEFSEKGSSKASSSSSNTSNGSGTSRGYSVRRNGSRKRNGCYAFFRPSKTSSGTSS